MILKYGLNIITSNLRKLVAQWYWLLHISVLIVIYKFKTWADRVKLVFHSKMVICVHVWPFLEQDRNWRIFTPQLIPCGGQWSHIRFVTVTSGRSGVPWSINPVKKWGFFFFLTNFWPQLGLKPEVVKTRCGHSYGGERHHFYLNSKQNKAL